MKHITLILGDGFDKAISVTALGKTENDDECQVMVRAFPVNDGDVIYLGKDKIKGVS